jgi:hypothetical protein
MAAHVAVEMPRNEPTLQGGGTFATPKIFKHLLTIGVLYESPCKILCLTTQRFGLVPKSFWLAEQCLETEQNVIYKI